MTRPGAAWSALGVAIGLTALVLARSVQVETDGTWPLVVLFGIAGMGLFLHLAPKRRWWPWTSSRVRSIRAARLLGPLGELRGEGQAFRERDRDESARRLPGWARDISWLLRRHEHPAADRFAVRSASMSERDVRAEYARLLDELEVVRLELERGEVPDYPADPLPEEYVENPPIRTAQVIGALMIVLGVVAWHLGVVMAGAGLIALARTVRWLERRHFERKRARSG